MAHFHVIAGTGDKLDLPIIRTITIADLGGVLRKGVDDFWEHPSHYVLLALIYPLVGIVLTVWMDGYLWRAEIPRHWRHHRRGQPAAGGLHALADRGPGAL